MAPTFHDLKTAYFLPILTATPEACPHRATQLASLQCKTIDMLHSVFAVCRTEHTTDHALALSLTVPHLRHVWETAAAMGLPTPLQHETQTL